jgi:transcriptional regulator with XRE-family HTH domain
VKRTLDERQAFFDTLVADVASGAIDVGGAVRRLRVEFLGVNQARFARMAGLSVRALRTLESGQGNPTMQTLDGVLRPFGLTVGIIRRAPT